MVTMTKRRRTSPEERAKDNETVRTWKRLQAKPPKDLNPAQQILYKLREQFARLQVTRTAFLEAQCTARQAIRYIYNPDETNAQPFDVVCLVAGVSEEGAIELLFKGIAIEAIGELMDGSSVCRSCGQPH